MRQSTKEKLKAIFTFLICLVVICTMFLKLDINNHFNSMDRAGFIVTSLLIMFFGYGSIEHYWLNSYRYQNNEQLNPKKLRRVNPVEIFVINK